MAACTTMTAIFSIVLENNGKASVTHPKNFVNMTTEKTIMAYYIASIIVTVLVVSLEVRLKNREITKGLVSIIDLLLMHAFAIFPGCHNS
jgi:hypothetical protein